MFCATAQRAWNNRNLFPWDNGVRPLNKPARNLEKISKRYNRDYFDGKIPKDLRIWWNDRIKDYGLTIGISDKDTGHVFFDIYINPDNHHGRAQVLLTLIHELAHVRLHPRIGHGRDFQEEMQRIALRGGLKGLW